ncbi:hypothetical protein PAECIP111802_04980 [Paenibacillus allorhizosphaerae]|uniref:Uncharacterized protein n=1 Tax=Paenibacillus allorhizosphaerae TaxID=2849866 RepID=A0ABM8VNH9_9BACL|nr:hypothetical protein PAECIP111802_04980 [Paenibacillus allorhizosphaerae]
MAPTYEGGARRMLTMLNKVTLFFRQLLEDEDTEILNYRPSRLIIMDEDFEYTV